MHADHFPTQKLALHHYSNHLQAQLGSLIFRKVEPPSLVRFPALVRFPTTAVPSWSPGREGDHCGVPVGEAVATWRVAPDTSLRDLKLHVAKTLGTQPVVDGWGEMTTLTITSVVRKQVIRLVDDGWW